MSMKDERLPFELLRNEWDKIKCNSHPRRSWFAQVELLRKELDLQDQVLRIKVIKKVLDKRECKEFEMAIQHKSKLRVYRALKQEIGFEEYLKYVKEAPSRLVFKFRSGTHGFVLYYIPNGSFTANDASFYKTRHVAISINRLCYY